MCIPKLAQDRLTKLDDIYCKYLLPYDTLLPAERQKLFDEVEADWAKREARARRNADRFINTESVFNEDNEGSSEEDDESEEEIDFVSMECIVNGRHMPLSQLFRIARNTMALWFKNTNPTVNEIEAEFWRHVAVRDSHVCVQSGSIDSSGWGYGFPSPGPKSKGSNYAKYPWNLKVLTNRPGSVIRSLGPVMGVTVPTLHVGMLFSACCWYRAPHGLSWIEYLHTGASKIWYGIPDDQSANFRAALTSLLPTNCQNKTIWLPCDTVMVPPHMLTDRGVSLCRIEQKPCEYIIVFPRAYTSSVVAGYVVCAGNKYDRHPLKVEIQPTIIPTYPTQILHIDILEIKNEKFIICIDKLTKFKKFFHSKNKSVLHIRDRLIILLHYFLAPETLVTDNEGSFVRPIVLNYIEGLGIKVCTVPTQKSEANGTIGIVHSTISEVFKYLQTEYPDYSIKSY